MGGQASSLSLSLSCLAGSSQPYCHTQREWDTRCLLFFVARTLSLSSHPTTTTFPPSPPPYPTLPRPTALHSLRAFDATFTINTPTNEPTQLVETNPIREWHVR
ncbi:hypothetical protein K440DRAFT_27446 [Wilcoxina mikolae CBS 423.85]|nr:hypothetical protein K440DRAFT_27446 [Wilcoxina mikolae CBS 423.85]